MQGIGKKDNRIVQSDARDKRDYRQRLFDVVLSDNKLCLRCFRDRLYPSTKASRILQMLDAVLVRWVVLEPERGAFSIELRT